MLLLALPTFRQRVWCFSDIIVMEDGVSPQIPLPDVSSAKGDVSVRFAYDERKRWFVLKTTYDREEKVADSLIRAGFYAYVARRYERQESVADESVKLKSLMPNILFAYLTPDEAAAFTNEGQHRSSSRSQFSPQVGLLYAIGPCFEPEPLTIDDKTMRNFILTTATCDEHVLMLSRNAFTVQGDCEYRIVDGPFTGVSGKRIRAYRQQRILVELEHLAWFCTPYIPTNCLQAING